MVNDILINKAASIERCTNRVREEYAKLNDFINFSKQLLKH